MQRIIPILTAFGLFAAAGAAVAQMPRTQAQARLPEPGGAEAVGLFKNGKHLETVSCRDFNLLDETVRPKAVVYAANYGPKGKAHPTVTVDDAVNIVPVVVDRCKAQPGDHFAATVRAAMRSARK